MKIILILLALFAFSGIATADYTLTYSWEGTATIMGQYGDILASISTVHVHDSAQSLYLVDDQASGTPEAYVAWVVGLTDGDEVTGSFWRYDTTPGTAPSCRIWAKWNDDPNDINGYNGSASGNSDYGPGTGWDETSYTWTVASGHTGIVISCRTYSNPGDDVWIDEMNVTVPDGAEIRFPGYVAIQRSTWADIKASF